MAPLVRRTWAPRGCTPLLLQRTRSHKRVSAIAAIICEANGRCPRLLFRLHADASINQFRVRSFLRQLRWQLKCPLVIVWDRLGAHQGEPVRQYLKNHPLLHTYLFPPYAPELNPVENLWCYLKMNPMANDAITDTPSLAHSTRINSRRMQYQPHLLRAFIRHTPLFSES